MNFGNYYYPLPTYPFPVTRANFAPQTGPEIVARIEWLLDKGDLSCQPEIRQLFMWLGQIPPASLTADMNYKVGKWYATGKSNVILAKFENINNALTQFEFAAQQGHPAAQYELGKMYDEGKVVPEDRQKAEYYLKLAADSTSDIALEAKFSLGMSYLKTNDLLKGMLCLDSCANQGYIWAQIRLGELFCKNELGIPPQFYHATHFYTLAAEKGNTVAKLELSELQFAESQYKKGIAHLKSTDVALAKTCFQQAANQGHPRAQCKLALLLLQHHTFESDKLAFDNLTKSASQNDCEGLFNLGLAYRDGRGVGRDMGLAIHFITLSGELGYVNKPEPIQTVIASLHSAVTKEDANGLYHLATAYLRGDGIPQSMQKALTLFQLASEKGHAGAQSSLAQLQRIKRR